MKLTPNNAIINIPLEQIKLTGNVRTLYDQDKIKDLADSIIKNGLLQPITVKSAGADDLGNETYDLICGHRRYYAYTHLKDSGMGYTSIPAVIRNGNKFQMQMVENIHRENLSQVETEKALKELLDMGMTQKEISLRLSKPISWVSDALAGTKVREVAEEAGIDTSRIATKSLSQLRSIPAEELPAAVAELNAAGGTYRAATKIKNEKNDSFSQFFQEPNKQIESPEKPKIKGLQNETAIKIQNAWRIFCKTYPDLSSATAFNFYQFLLNRFEVEGK